MTGVEAGVMELALQILLSDLDIAQGHVGGAVAQQFRQEGASQTILPVSPE